MPIRYLGLTCNYFGRPLWEILLNLKNFGKGRIVVRKSQDNYPEISYYEILRVEPAKIEYSTRMYGTIWVKKTFRGKTYKNEEDIGQVSYKPDYVLIPKHEEEAFMKSKPRHRDYSRINPRYMELPPLWQEFVRREKALQNLPVTEDDLRIKMVYRLETENLYDHEFHIQKEGQKPSYEQHEFITLVPELYKDVNWTRKSESSSDQEMPSVPPNYEKVSSFYVKR